MAMRKEDFRHYDKSVGVTDFQNKFSEYAREAVTEKERLLIEKNNIPFGVYLSYNDFEELLEKVEDLIILAKPEIQKRLNKSAKEFNEGKGRDFDDLARKLGL